MWSYFNIITYLTIALWLVGGGFIYSKSKALRGFAITSHLVAIVLIGGFIVALWKGLERPPLRTLAETRIWYAFFMGLIGYAIYLLYRQKWMLSYSAVMGIVFVGLTYTHPDTMNKALMPALQSPWFAPHVIVYMFAYALLGAATVMAIYLLFVKKKPATDDEMDITDNLVYVGLSFMTLGMLMGALWAKEAWGHYWAWDPKETWAAVTWFAYLAYVHFRRSRPHHLRPALYMLIVSFLLLQMCWWGINYLPAAMGSSVHTYNLS